MSRSRELTEHANRFECNAWDNVHPSQAQKEAAEEKIRRDEEQIANLGTLGDVYSYSSAWDTFYRKHRMGFFKPRKWITEEFPELKKEGVRIFEVGCGTGSSLEQLSGHAQVFGVDCSSNAVSIISHRKEFASASFSAHDATSNFPFPYKDMDFVLLIFTLSAIHPSAHEHVLRKIAASLKPGGFLFFRDYARMDMAQLRFKPEQTVEQNTYLRGEGTYAHFFTEERLRALVENAGLVVSDCRNDQKLLTNRKKRLEMQRIWLQMRAYKPQPK